MAETDIQINKDRRTDRKNSESAIYNNWNSLISNVQKTKTNILYS